LKSIYIGGYFLIEDFRVKISLEGTINSHWHFTASKDGIDYNGHYDGGEIYWLRPIPEDHYRDQMEESIHDFMAHREPLDSEIR